MKLWGHKVTINVYINIRNLFVDNIFYFESRVIASCNRPNFCQFIVPNLGKMFDTFSSYLIISKS